LNKKRTSIRIADLLLVLFYMLTAAPCSWAVDPSALRLIEGFHATLLGVMKEGERIGYRGRYDRLRPVIEAAFDFPFISELILGRHREGLSREQKARFIDTFTRLSIATYAARFDGYSGERFQIASAEDLKADRIRIETKLIQSGGEEVRLDYVLHKAGGRWRIINVVANGVSDLALKRSDYTAFLEKRGFDALIKELDGKIAGYSR
jgi:phospholipid transport system substrate-binding protein